MLSILIPTYNYDVYRLVHRLHQECTALGIVFEIICSDDASTVAVDFEKILTLANCQYYRQDQNIGLSNSRNFLIECAQYDFNLILDADTLPVLEDFVKKYLDTAAIHPEKIISGGLLYRDDHIPENMRLRWIYGNSREAIASSIRQKKPYNYSLCSNIFFSKKALKNVRFNDDIREYGYEDFVFFKTLQQNDIHVYHLNNPVFHLKIETSLEFLNKTQRALHTLDVLVNKKLIHKRDTALLKAYQSLNSLQLTKVTRWIFLKNQERFEKNLLSDSPSLLLFDLYKLGYFCSLQGSK